ncbi:MAG: nucleotidyltransferase domain-containing protein [Candidatus Omnitrophica bacterium]|nr:nucleotidyltransferase domain-containing protein [Candidatus Omnitrophota bacterium]
MRPMQEKNLDAKIGKDLRQLGVAIVYLYGSEALQRASLLSDIDVGIVLKDTRPIAKDRKQKYQLYSKFLNLLEPILAPGPSREIDLVFLQAASPILRFQAINAGHILFTADPVFQADFEASVIRDYLDIRPLVETHFQAALERAA